MNHVIILLHFCALDSSRNPILAMESYFRGDASPIIHNRGKSKRSISRYLSHVHMIFSISYNKNFHLIYSHISSLKMRVYKLIMRITTMNIELIEIESIIYSYIKINNEIIIIFPKIII